MLIKTRKLRIPRSAACLGARFFSKPESINTSASFLKGFSNRLPGSDKNRLLQLQRVPRKRWRRDVFTRSYECVDPADEWIIEYLPRGVCVCVCACVLSGMWYVVLPAYLQIQGHNHKWHPRRGHSLALLVLYDKLQHTTDWRSTTLLKGFTICISPHN